MITLHKNYNGYYFDELSDFYILCEIATDEIILITNSLDLNIKND